MHEINLDRLTCNKINQLINRPKLIGWRRNTWTLTKYLIILTFNNTIIQYNTYNAHNNTIILTFTLNSHS